MKQRQDLGRAAPDVFVRLRRWSPSRLPRHTRMRHGLKGTGLVLTPDREPKLRQSPSCARAQAAPEPKLRPQRGGLLDQLFWARASGSRTRTTPCLRRRIATPVSHQVRLFCQLRPLACRAARMQRAPDRERADLRQPIRSVAQGSLQQAHGPGGRAVLLALGRAGPFGQDALLRLSAIADPWSAPMAPWPGRTAASPSRLKRLTQAEIVSLCRRPTWWAAAV